MENILGDDACKKWESAIRKIAGEFVCCGLDLEDLVAEGFQGLLEAKQTYKRERGCSFDGFAERCIRHKIRDAAAKWKPLIPTKEDALNILAHSQSREAESIDPKITHGLSDREFRVVTYYYGFIGGESMTLKEIAEVMDLSIETVRKIRNSALGKMRAKAA